ncbi:MAG: leucine-rich repeat protein, partial [Alistipes sp.]|nr:leucine-rich repeat protein [Alistipes sp.]
AVGGEVEVKVTTNLEYTVEIPAEAKEWLSVADTRAVIREETLTFTVAKNETLDERSATVELKGADGKVLQSIVFKQKEYGGTIEVDEEYVVDAKGGELEVKLSTDIDFTTSIPEEAKSWISIIETRSMRSEGLTFDIAINDDVNERSATINLQNAKGNDVASFVIRQKGGNAVLELKNQYSISNMGGNFEVAVTTNLEYEVEISADATSWLSYVETRALRTDKLIFNATHNEGEAERSGTIKLIGEDNEELQVINIYQRGNIYEFSYKTNDGKPIYPLTTDGFGGEFIENRFDATTSEGRLIFSGAVTTIPMQAFCYCENLTLFDIPDGITTIGDSAFCGCSNLMRITIPHSVIEFGNQAFQGCTGELIINSNIPNPSSDSDSSPFGGSKFTKVTIGDSVTTIGNYAFYYCGRLTSVTIPDSVTTIGNYAFDGCVSLTTITIPDSVTTIGNYAFDGCNGLENIIIGDGVTIIGAGAFRDCNSLKDTTIGKGVLSIEQKAFQGCTGKLSVYCNIPDRKYWEDRASSYTSGFSGAGFSEVVIGDNVTTIGKYAFEGLGRLERVTIGNGVTMIGDKAFSKCESLKNITMGKSITSIGVAAFYHCIDIESIIIPENVTSIGADAFRECDSITSIIIPDKVNTIGGSAFQSCYNLTSALIGDGVTSINQWTFKDSGLKTIVIGKSVASIDSEAFFRPYAIYCKALTPPNINGDEMSNLFISTSIYVPTESVRLYKMANAWHDFSENIEGYDFNQTATINYTTTDGNIADVNFYAISNEYNNGIGKVVYYGDGTIIPARAFSDCVNLESVTIPSSVKIIGNNAFYGCSNLINITIPDSVTSIGDFAFDSCSNLKSVTIGNSITSIRDYAFFDCNNLTSVYCKAMVPPMGGVRMFDYYHSFQGFYHHIGCAIYVPSESVEAYKIAGGWSSYASEIAGCDF